MRCLKRAIRNLNYRYKSYILLGIGFFLIAFLLFISLGIRENIRRVSEEMKSQYGGTIDIYSLRSDKNQSVEESSWLPKEDVEKIEKLSEVTKVYTTKDVAITALNFTACNIFEKEEGEADVILYAMDRPDFYAPFETGEYRLTEGTLELGEKDALVPALLAKENDWNLGSSIKIMAWNGEKEVELSIVGIYSCPYEYVVPNYANPNNAIIAKTSVAVEVSNKPTYKGCAVSISNPDKVEEVIHTIEELELSSKENMGIENASIEYLTAEQTLHGIRSLMNVVVAGVLIVGILVLIMFSYNQFMGRIHEVGILYALGEKIRYIIVQSAVENLMIMLVAYACAVCISSFILPLFMGYFVNIQDMGVEFFLSFGVCLQVALIFFILLVILMMLPLIVIAKVKPKEILTMGS